MQMPKLFFGRSQLAPFCQFSFATNTTCLFGALVHSRAIGRLVTEHQILVGYRGRKLGIICDGARQDCRYPHLTRGRQSGVSAVGTFARKFA